MHISPQEEYGLRCLLQVARAGEGKSLPASKIADSEGISVEYVSKLMHLFRKAGLVGATRGVQGGFFLEKPANEIVLGEVFAALQIRKNLSHDFCDQYTGKMQNCVHLAECTIRPLWKLFGNYFNGLLAEVYLSDLTGSEKDMNIKMGLAAARYSRQVLPKDFADEAQLTVN